MLSIGNIMVVSIVVGSTLPYGFFIFSFYVKPFLVAKQYPHSFFETSTMVVKNIT
jgi:hypothetical protein